MHLFVGGKAWVGDSVACRGYMVAQVIRIDNAELTVEDKKKKLWRTAFVHPNHQNW